MENNQVNTLRCHIRVLPDVATLPDHEVLQESLATRTMNAARVRAAILDVIDAGAEPACGRVPWLFWTPDTPENNETRSLFADRVQQRIEELEKVGLP